MQKLGIIVGLCLAVAQAGTVSAKSLEEVLKEKGVITEEDYKEVMKSTPVRHKFGEGITLTSADGNFSTSIGGYVQARYTFLDYDNANANGSTIPYRTDSSQFEVKRAKLAIGGHAFSKNVTYSLITNFSNIAGGSTKNGGLLENAWINYKVRDELQIRGGQEKVQFGRQWLVSATDLQFVDVSHVTTAFAPTYDTGVRLHGKIAGLFTYSVAGSGGLGQNFVRATPNNAFSARITANPLGDMKNSEADIENSPQPRLSLGTSYYRNTITVGELAGTSNSLGFLKSNTGWYTLSRQVNSKTLATGENIDFNMVTLDAAFKWRGLSVTGEYMWGEGDAQTSKNNYRGTGFYAQAGYMIVPGTVELAYRYAYLDPNRDAVNDHWIENSAGVSWYIKGHALKLQADYTRIHKQAALVSANAAKPNDDNQARLQLQLVF